MNSISLAARDSMSLLLDIKYYSWVIYSTFLNITLKVQFCLPRYDSDYIFVKIIWPKFQRELNIFPSHKETICLSRVQLFHMGFTSCIPGHSFVGRACCQFLKHCLSFLCPYILMGIKPTTCLFLDNQVTAFQTLTQRSIILFLQLINTNVP